MGRADIYPFASVGDYHGERYPDWIRGLKAANGVYLIRDRRSGDILYVGESHSDRLYGTLTRHFQHWSPAWSTAGPTYDRDAIDVAVVVVARSHAIRLQDDILCALGAPPDNRVICAADDDDRDPDDPDLHPRGYDFDVDAIVAALFHEFDDVSGVDPGAAHCDDHGDDEEIPF